MFSVVVYIINYNVHYFVDNVPALALHLFLVASC